MRNSFVTSGSEAFIRLAIMAALVSITAASGCGGEKIDRASPNGIVLVTVEALRADSLAMRESPFAAGGFERVAAMGTTFENATAAVPMARPSVSSILTGVAPDRTGVRSNLLDSLAPGTPTVASRLRDAGWTTAGLVASPFVSWASGLQEGFGLFDGPEGQEVGPLRHFPVSVPDEEMADRFGRWLQSLQPDERFLGWVDLAGLHGLDADAEDVRDAYGAALEGTDRAIATILGALESAGRLEDTAIVVVGTHGVMLGEEGNVGDSYWLRDETLRVRLMVKAPGFEPGARSTGPVWLPDVAATIAALAGVSLGDDLDGVPLGTAEGESRRAWTWAPDDEFAMPTLTAVMDEAGGWSVFSWDELKSAAPVESASLTAAMARPARPRNRVLPQELMDALEEIGAVKEWPDNVSAELSPEQRQAFLADIRALRLTMARPAGEGRRRDLRKTSRALVDAYPGNLGMLTHRLFFLVLMGGQSRAEGLSEEAVKRFPLRPDALHWAAHVDLLSGKTERGEALVEAAMALTGPDPDMLYDLACARALGGDTDAALTRLAESLELGFRNWEHLERDVDLDSVRADPRYAELLRKHGR